jgi:hypothetical protein
MGSPMRYFEVVVVVVVVGDLGMKRINPNRGVRGWMGWEVSGDNLRDKVGRGVGRNLLFQAAILEFYVV